jgi:uncharacterized protein
MTEVTIRVYGPLNDFLAANRRQMSSVRRVGDHPSVKDVIESHGIPHPEIDLVLVNGASVDFGHAVHHGDRIAVFPRFASFDVSTLTRVRPKPPDAHRFVADVHLGKLARRLRLAGLDTAYRNDVDDATLAETAEREARILLTRDLGLLKRRSVSHGYFIRETGVHRQFVEVLRRFGPLDVRPFSRCLRCNAVLEDVPKAAVEALLQPRTRQHYDRFYKCLGCGRVYWRGSHWARLTRAIDAARTEAERGAVDVPRIDSAERLVED